MSPELTAGQISILQSLRDGDDPLLRAPDAELIFFSRDLSTLRKLGLITASIPGNALTLEGIDELRKPEHAYIPPK